MLKNFESGKVRNIQVEVVVAEKPVQVNINEHSANAWLPVSDDNQSSVSVAMNIETGKVSTSLNSIDSIEAVLPVVDELTTAIKAVVAELQTI